MTDRHVLDARLDANALARALYRRDHAAQIAIGDAYADQPPERIIRLAWEAATLTAHLAWAIEGNLSELLGRHVSAEVYFDKVAAHHLADEEGDAQ